MHRVALFEMCLVFTQVKMMQNHVTSLSLLFYEFRDTIQFLFYYIFINLVSHWKSSSPNCSILLCQHNHDLPYLLLEYSCTDGSQKRRKPMITCIGWRKKMFSEKHMGHFFAHWKQCVWFRDCNLSILVYHQKLSPKSSPENLTRRLFHKCSLAYKI